MGQDSNDNDTGQSSSWETAKDGQNGTSGDSMWTILSRELKDRVIEDLEHPQDVVALWGYRFSGSNVTFLYLNLQFNDYLVISHEEVHGEKAAYIHHIDLATPLCPMAGSIVWVRAGANLRHVRSHTATAKAEQAAGMLHGAIQGLMQYGPCMPPLPLADTGGSHKMKSMMGTGNNTPGCPYRPPTSDCPPTFNNCQTDS
jgi:hypothetical protein